MNRLLIVAFAICAVFTVQGFTDKIKRESSLSSRLFQDLSSNIHTRKRRSEEENSYILFDNRSGKRAQLWWRDQTEANGRWTKFQNLEHGSTVSVDSFTSHEWTAVVDSAVESTLRINGKEDYNPQPNTVDTRATCVITRPDQKKAKIRAFIKTLVVVDKSVRDKFNSDDEAKKYVEVLFSLASNVYKHNSLTRHGLKIKIVVSKIIIRNEEIKFNPSKGGDNVYVACKTMNKLGNNGPQRFDHKLFLTRNQFGAGGYARSNGMCSQYSSCSIVLDHGFHSTFLIAHEIAHSLGLSHGSFSQNSRYIMAGMVDGLFHDHRWSPKSQQALLANIRKHTCILGKKPTGPKSYKYPGVFYSFEKQCDLEFDEDYTAWQPSRWERGDPCKILKCRMPGKWSSFTKTTNSPALDGTECGANKWCVEGKCTVKMSESVMGRL